MPNHSLVDAGCIRARDARESGTEGQAATIRTRFIAPGQPSTSTSADRSAPDGQDTVLIRANRSARFIRMGAVKLHVRLHRSPGRGGTTKLKRRDEEGTRAYDAYSRWKGSLIGRERGGRWVLAITSRRRPLLTSDRSGSCHERTRSFDLLRARITRGNVEWTRWEFQPRDGRCDFITSRRRHSRYPDAVILFESLSHV